MADPDENDECFERRNFGAKSGSCDACSILTVGHVIMLQYIILRVDHVMHNVDHVIVQ